MQGSNRDEGPSLLLYPSHTIDIRKNVQKEEWFLEINPNERIPALTDGEQRVFES
jgi:glutathione S-transferase